MLLALTCPGGAISKVAAMARFKLNTGVRDITIRFRRWRRKLRHRSHVPEGPVHPLRKPSPAAELRRDPPSLIEINSAPARTSVHNVANARCSALCFAFITQQRRACIRFIGFQLKRRCLPRGDQKRRQ